MTRYRTIVADPPWHYDPFPVGRAPRGMTTPPPDRICVVCQRNVADKPGVVCKRCRLEQQETQDAA